MERHRERETPVEEAFSILWNHLVVEDPIDEVADAIFCFGSRHWRVPERVASLHRAGVADLVLITGGTSTDEITEADRFGGTLERSGIPAASILRERHASNTGENVRYGLEMLERSGPVTDLVFVSWPLAARRCHATFARWAPRLRVRSAPALPRPGYRWAVNAKRIRLALGEHERLERYVDTGVVGGDPAPSSVTEAARVLAEILPFLSGDRTGSAHDAPTRRIEPARTAGEPENVPVFG